MNRIKLRNKQGEVRWESEDVDLLEWLDGKIPPVPQGQLCEMNESHYDEEVEPRPEATSWSYTIKDGHVCYSYVCDDCQDRLDHDGIDPNDYPTTDAGYAAAPRHCS